MERITEQKIREARALLKRHEEERKWAEFERKALLCVVITPVIVAPFALVAWAFLSGVNVLDVLRSVGLH